MKLGSVDIGGKTYPLLCDLNVLEKLQEEFGTVNTFERELLGLFYVKDEKGEIRHKEDGSPMMGLREPSIRAVKAALIGMINEGLAYRAHLEGKPFDPADGQDILAGCQIPYTELADILHDVYKECFATKKPMPRKTQKPGNRR